MKKDYGTMGHDPPHYMFYTHTHTHGNSKRRRERYERESIFKEIMAENIPNLERNGYPDP